VTALAKIALEYLEIQMEYQVGHKKIYSTR
jgi:hypothetical protein